MEKPIWKIVAESVELEMVIHTFLRPRIRRFQKINKTSIKSIDIEIIHNGKESLINNVKIILNHK